ncbi:MAG: DUF6364 family protein [Spirochaetales bacterium]
MLGPTRSCVLSHEPVATSSSSSVVRRAKSFAPANETSVSALVESYLKNLTIDDPAPMTADPNRGLKLRDRLSAEYLHD